LSVLPRLSTTLPTFAAERRRLQLGAQHVSIDICCRRRRSAANLPSAVAADDRWDRQTDGQTPDRYIHPAQNTTRAVSINFGSEFKKHKRTKLKTLLSNQHDRMLQMVVCFFCGIVGIIWIQRFKFLFPNSR